MKTLRCARLAGLAILVLLPGAARCGQKKPPTQKEESYMFGRIMGAIEDAGGGYTKEALSKFSSINKALEKREYSMRTRWLAHNWYGKTLLGSGDPKTAVQVLQIAQEEAKSLTEKEQKETAELLRQAQDKLRGRPRAKSN